MLDLILNEFPKYFPEVNNILAAGIPIFARIAGLMRVAPFLQRFFIPIFVLLIIFTIFAERNSLCFTIKTYKNHGLFTRSRKHVCSKERS